MIHYQSPGMPYSQFLFTVTIFAESGPRNIREGDVSTPKPSAADDIADDFPLQESGQNGEHGYLLMYITGLLMWDEGRVKFAKIIHNMFWLILDWLVRY